MLSELPTRPQGPRLVRSILKPPPPAKTSMFSSIFSAVSREIESFVENVRGVEHESPQKVGNINTGHIIIIKIVDRL